MFNDSQFSATRFARFRLSLLLLLTLTVVGCQPPPQVTVRPQCDLPPIPAKYTDPCQKPQPLPDGKLSTLYQQNLKDTGPSGSWTQCINRHDQLVEFMKYQESICKKIAEESKPQPGFFDRLFGK